MPRRKKPLQKAVVGETVALDDVVVDLAAKLQGFLRKHPTTGNLDQLARDRMSLRIAEAYQYARLDLGLILSGKGAKPDAWQLDIFCFDVAEAWREAELEPTLWEEGADRSKFTDFVNQLEAVLGVKWHRASLVNNAKRAREIERL